MCCSQTCCLAPLGCAADKKMKGVIGPVSAADPVRTNPGARILFRDKGVTISTFL